MTESKMSHDYFTPLQFQITNFPDFVLQIFQGFLSSLL